MGIGQEILNVPFGDMVFQVASAIATSQAELDKSSVEIMSVMGNADAAPVFLPMLDKDGNEIEVKTSMIGAGFQPAFYQFSDAIIEVKMAISMGYDSEYSSGYTTEAKSNIESKYKDTKYTAARTTTINANYTSKYNFNEEASSSLRVRLVPLPPNPIMQRLIELRAQRQQLEYELKIKEAEAALKDKTDSLNQ